MTWVILLLILAAGLWLLSIWLRRQTGLPGGEIISSDMHMWGAPVEKPLFDGSLGITGKPDYLIRKGSEIIPVEVKSSRPPRAPYDAHIFQLSLYCLLVEKVYQHTPGYGLIHYPGRTFSVPFTNELRESTLNLVSQMHRQENGKNIPRSHTDSWKCASCGYKDVCDQKIA